MDGNRREATVPARDVTSQVISLLSELEAPDVDVSTELAALDLDSLTITYIFSYFERIADVEFDNDALIVERYTTVGDLCTAIEATIEAARA